MPSVYFGYHDCPCRDCFDVAIGEMTDRPGVPALCHACADAGCNADGTSGCERSRFRLHRLSTAARRQFTLNQPGNTMSPINQETP